MGSKEMTKAERKALYKKKKLEKKRRQFFSIATIVVLFGVAVISYILWDAQRNSFKPDPGQEELPPVVPSSNRIAVIETSMGTIKVELYEDKMPQTTKNFIDLAQSGFYEGLIFHRVIDGFMIQGGGFQPGMVEKPANEIPFEESDVKHEDGTISMARRGDSKDSASSQFFICDGAQPNLDGEYAAFGKVKSGMEVVRAISAVPTQSINGYDDVPVEDVLIYSVTITTQ